MRWREGVTYLALGCAGVSASGCPSPFDLCPLLLRALNCARSAIRKMFGDEIDPEVIDELMAEADTDNNGEVDLEEFKAIMRAGHQKFGSITKAMLTLRAMTDVESMQSMLKNAKEEIEEVRGRRSSIVCISFPTHCAETG